MIVTPMSAMKGDVAIVRQDGRETLWRVERRRGGGYDMDPLGQGDRRFWSDVDLSVAHGERRLRWIQYDSNGLGKHEAEVLSRTWEFWPEDKRDEAMRRMEFVRRVDVLAPLHDAHIDQDRLAKRRDRCRRAAARLEDPPERETSLVETFKRVAKEVWDEHGARFATEARETALLLHRGRTKRKVEPTDDVLRYAAPRQPSWSTVRNWWMRWDESGGDVRSLISHDFARGNREPFHKGGGAETYRVMALMVDDHYKTTKRPNAKAVWRTHYEPRCMSLGLPTLSYQSFLEYIRLKNCPRDVFEKRYGRRAAKLRYKIFKRRKPPERPLEEVEVDHCLIDLVVTHPKTGRPMGRPWLTVLIDRATRAILGCHISFEVPSWASLERALAHSLWPKDVSGMPGVEGSWPMHGVMMWLYTDNGREFRSASLRLAEAMLDFAAVALPAKTPELKGMVEKLFGTIGVQVFSLEEGSVLAKSDEYDPAEKARLTLAETNLKIVRWIVDVYHDEPQEVLRNRTPLEAWIEQTALYPVRPVPDFDHIVRLTGTVIPRKISNVGVEYAGFLFSDDGELERLRETGGLDRDWTIRVDPYNYGEIWILDDVAGRWISLPNTNPAISVGVTRFQHAQHITRAKAIAAHDGRRRVSEGDLLVAKLEIKAEVEATLAESRRLGAASMAMRYQTNGEFSTPLAGASSDTLGPAPAALPAPTVVPTDVTAPPVPMLPSPTAEPVAAGLPSAVPEPSRVYQGGTVGGQSRAAGRPKAAKSTRSAVVAFADLHDGLDELTGGW